MVGSENKFKFWALCHPENEGETALCFEGNVWVYIGIGE